MASHEVRIGERTVTVDPADFTIDRDGSGVYLVSDGTRRWRVVAAGPSDDRWIFVDGRAERVEVLARGRTRERARTRAHDMTAPMPATVVKVLVEPGAHVEKGAPVILLEAMKMELAVRAAHAGTVRVVHCAPGELVRPGVQLLEVDE